MDYKQQDGQGQGIAAGITTETKPEQGGDLTANPAAPHPAGQYVRDQIPGAEAASGVTGSMGEIRQDLSGTDMPATGAGLQHVDYSDDPLFQQISQHIGAWAQQSRMVPEQFGALVGQAVAQWAGNQGDNFATGIACLHQMTAFFGQNIGGGATAQALGTTTRQLETAGTTAQGKPGT